MNREEYTGFLSIVLTYIVLSVLSISRILYNHTLAFIYKTLRQGHKHHVVGCCAGILIFSCIFYEFTVTYKIWTSPTFAPSFPSAFLQHRLKKRIKIREISFRERSKSGTLMDTIEQFDGLRCRSSCDPCQGLSL